MDSGVVIIGTGGQAKTIWGLAISMGINVLGFVHEEKQGGDLFGMNSRILGNDEWFVTQPCRKAVIAIGMPGALQRLAEFYRDSLHEFITLIHPSAICITNGISWHGVIVMPNVVIQPGVSIGDFSYINAGATIGHDTGIGSYCGVGPNVALSGCVSIGDGVLIGAGASIREGVTIGDGATIGMGAAVVCDVPPGETWVGVPARKLNRE